MDKEDENGGHGYMEFGSIGSTVVQVFYADDIEQTTHFNTKKEAESWANAHQEVIEIESD